MRAGQLKGLGADERRHHVEEKDDGHDEGGRQEQHGSGRACRWGGGRRAVTRPPGLREAPSAARPGADSGSTAGTRLRRGATGPGRRREEEENAAATPRPDWPMGGAGAASSAGIGQ